MKYILLISLLITACAKGGGSSNASQSLPTPIMSPSAAPVIAEAPFYYGTYELFQFNSSLYMEIDGSGYIVETGSPSCESLGFPSSITIDDSTTGVDSIVDNESFSLNGQSFLFSADFQPDYANTQASNIWNDYENLDTQIPRVWVGTGLGTIQYCLYRLHR